jgi:membrane-bound ClpP family serine protease
MTVLGVTLLVLGVLLVVAETHVPSGTLGVVGGFVLIAGGIVATTSAGGAVALAVPVGVALGLAAGIWTVIVSREAIRSPQRRIRSGAEALSGRVGVVRRWSGAAGQVFLDGARPYCFWSRARSGARETSGATATARARARAQAARPRCTRATGSSSSTCKG